MNLLGTLRRRWKWLVPLAVIAPLVFFSSSLLELYYAKVERPRLLAKGGSATPVPCNTYEVQLADRVPRSCDLALLATKPDGTKVEYFFFTDGSRLSHESLNGRWRSSSAECTSAQRLTSLSLLGIALIGVSVLSHSARTRQWFYFPGMKREPMNDFETVVGIYGTIIFGGSIVASASAGCAAMALL